MKPSIYPIVGKTVYSLIFLVILPAGLWVWAKNASPSVHLPVLYSTTWGIIFIASGAVIMLSGMFALMTFGKGLPMNAYPPPEFVYQGIFRVMPHPVYTGFVLICFGVSIYSGSTAGFWLVTPVVMAACAALVWGYENIELRQRFPEVPRQYLLSAPPAEETPPTFWNILAVYVCALLPWLLMYTAIFGIYVSPDILRTEVIDQLLSGQNPYFLLSGMAALLWILIMPWLARTKQQLRQYFFAGLAGSAADIYSKLIFPEISFHLHSAETSSFLVYLSYNLTWMWLWISAGFAAKIFPGFRKVIFFSTGLITLSALIFGDQPYMLALSSLPGLLTAFYYADIWKFLRKSAEGIANSWKEWVFGPIRVINHGFYVGGASFLGVMMGGILAGREYIFPMVVFGVIVTICAGLWGQFIEGSDKLKRPFGFYGGMVGIAIASYVMHVMEVNVWVMLGVFSVFMPWVQGIGRFRCLVNGCCHGSKTEDWLGIRYTHPRSRVCFISGLKGEYLHPTPLYSMLWLFLVGGFQWKLWQEGADLSFIFGMYLILNGLGRFVEEAYRGEPQTPVLYRLRLYQWAALVSVLAGIVLTCLSAPMPELFPDISWHSLGWGAFTWIFVQFLMGIDFPKSTKRFSRLT